MNANINGTENMNEEQINFNDDEVIKVSQMSEKLSYAYPKSIHFEIFPQSVKKASNTDCTFLQVTL